MLSYRQASRTLLRPYALGGYLSHRVFNPHSDVAFEQQDLIHNAIPYARYQHIPVEKFFSEICSELRLKLDNGGFLWSGCCDWDNPEARAYGEWIRVEDAKGREVLYVESDEWQADPIGTMFKILNALDRTVTARPEAP